MNTKPKILTVGSANLDYVITLDHIPARGETMTDKGTVRTVPGGKGANTALAIARLGGESVFCTALGTDEAGDRLHALYTSEGMDCRFIERSTELATGAAVVMVEGTGDNRIVVYPGANGGITHAQVDRAFEVRPDALCLQFEISFDSVLHAAYTAYSKGVPIVVDAGPISDSVQLSKLPPLEIFSPNESETLAITGIELRGTESCLEALLALSKVVTAKYYVIKMGSRGCLVYDGRMPRFYDPYRVKAVDTTAAGDTFTAALTLAYLETEGNMPAAAKFANAAAGLSVTVSGASESIPTRMAVDSFMASN